MSQKQNKQKKLLTDTNMSNFKSVVHSLWFVDWQRVAHSPRSHLLGHGLCELLGFLWVHAIHRRHLSSRSRSWHIGGLSAGSALSRRLRVKTDRCLNLKRFDGYYF